MHRSSISFYVALLKYPETKVLKQQILSQFNEDGVFSVDDTAGNSFELHLGQEIVTHRKCSNPERFEPDHSLYVSFWWKGQQMPLSFVQSFLEWMAKDVTVIDALVSYSFYDTELNQEKTTYYKLGQDNMLHEVTKDETECISFKLKLLQL